MIQTWEISSLTVYFKAVLIIIDDCNYFIWGLSWVFNFKEWMIMRFIKLFTLFTQIKICANSTFVTNSLDRAFSTIITSNMRMNDFWFNLNFRILFFLFNLTLFNKFRFNFWNDIWHHLSYFFFQNTIINLSFRKFRWGDLGNTFQFLKVSQRFLL